jgi:hypothetical protein
VNNLFIGCILHIGDNSTQCQGNEYLLKFYSHKHSHIFLRTQSVTKCTNIHTLVNICICNKELHLSYHECMYLKRYFSSSINLNINY